MKDMINDEIKTSEVNKKSNKKVIIISIISVIAIIVIGLVVTYFILSDKVKENEYKELLQSKLSLQDKVVEYGSEETFEVQDNVKIYKDNNEIKTYKFSEVGSIKFIESIKGTYKNLFNQDKEIEISRNVIYTIIDTKAPIIEGVEDKTIVEGTEIDLKEGIKAYDEIDGNLDIVVDGDVDTNTVGEYTVSVKAVDRNNNETIKEYKVIVEDKSVVNKNISNNSKKYNSSNTKGSNTNSSTAYSWGDEEWKGEDKNNRVYIPGGHNYYYYGGSVELTEEQAETMVTKIIE